MVPRALETRVSTYDWPALREVLNQLRWSDWEKKSEENGRVNLSETRGGNCVGGKVRQISEEKNYFMGWTITEENSPETVCSWSSSLLGALASNGRYYYQDTTTALVGHWCSPIWADKEIWRSRVEDYEHGKHSLGTIWNRHCFTFNDPNYIVGLYFIFSSYLCLATCHW